RRGRMNIQIDSTDLPVNPVFTDSLQSLGFYVKHTSRWLNGAIAVLDFKTIIDSVNKPSFVDTFILRRIAPLKSVRNKFDLLDSVNESNIYGSALTQISQLNGDKLHELSQGEGVHIAVIDAGFLNADLVPQFEPLFEEGRILGTYDFVKPENNIYRGHYHGTMVLSTMAVNQPGEYIGTAPAASYWLMRSEDAAYEYPAEEDYWVVAVEYADSLGCDVVNTSLGYTIFDYSGFNHTYEEFNGDSIRMAKAANLAVDKGMVLVCSAGNSGNDPWYYISAPSEAKNVLSLAAVNGSGEITGFSSRGFSEPDFPPKPDISTMGSATRIVNPEGEYQNGSGTSFSSPIAAGMAACLSGLFPNNTAHEIIDAIRQSASLYPQHSPEYGYGIPDFYLAYQLLKGSNDITTFKNELTHISPNPFNDHLFITDFEGFSEIKLFSPDGKIKLFSKLSSCNDSKFTSVNTEMLPRGMYILVLKGNEKNYAQKIIKQ
ncbi:MAG: S8 family peptidase, partial [Prolixibacteraceae bacterium]|nr:S8 family peptidase [Prolixibacteraceae bacterium]